jgi:acyl-coenzyme A synthetase/AMP-(fatty) acid ligase/L-amino acid N-acyltransferase YncA/acyl carrier protein
MKTSVNKQQARGAEERPSVVEEFEARVETSPGDAAVMTAEGPVSFAELDAYANAVANELIVRLGSGPEPIPLLVRAPHLMLGAMLGSLKAGKFYAAVNPNHPWPRNRQILGELDARIQLTDSTEASIDDAHCLDISNLIERANVNSPDLQFEPSRLAYVVYTSGSSGRPRGIAHSRTDMLHNLKRHQPLQISQDDRLTLISADGFVAAVSNPFLGLVQGATLFPYSFRSWGAEGMVDWLRGAGVTVVYTFPSFLRQLSAFHPSEVNYRSLRLIYLGGEAVRPSDLDAARKLFPKATIAIGLNSSETGLTCLHLVSPKAGLPNPVPVGRPVEGIAIEVVNEEGQPAPPGTAGELVVRSEHVQPRLWREGEAPAPLAEGPRGHNGLRTGDRVRAAADGTLFHVGRCDEMIKVRGFRVETSEVEAAIAAIDGVSEVAVVGAPSPTDGETALAAYVVAPGWEVDEVSVRSAVARSLPTAMIPTKLHQVDSLPRTANGKVHRLALLAREERAVQQEPREKPSAAPEGQAEIEARVAEIWATVLGDSKISPEDNFFALGGTSISALAVISGIREAFKNEIPLSALFENPTVRGLADVIAAMTETGDRSTPNEGTPRIRLAREEDFGAVTEIVNHYIDTTPYNFRTASQKPEDWIAQWFAARDRYPWLVAVSGTSVVGIAYAERWKNRSAYDWCAEVTGYVANDWRRKGVGRALYEPLLPQLDAQGYRTQLAVITLPNPGSVGLHESFGFEQAGALRRVGYKQGAWWSVGFWQRASASLAPPGEIRPVLDVWGHNGSD